MATVTIQKRTNKQGTVSYIVRYKDQIRRTRHFKTFRRLKDAQKAAHELRSRIDLGESPKIKRTEPRPLTFAEVAQSLVETWKKRLALGTLSERSVEERSIRVRVLNRTFGTRLLPELTRADIEDYLAETCIRKSKISANRDLFVIKQVFKAALEKGATAEDPASGIRYFSEKAHQRNRFLLPEELNRLLAACEQTKARYYLPALVLLGAEHGASKQEALDLEWKHVNFGYKERGIIRFFRTKNAKERTQYLMPRTKEALLRWLSVFIVPSSFCTIIPKTIS